jgi:hypothetical protein
MLKRYQTEDVETEKGSEARKVLIARYLDRGESFQRKTSSEPLIISSLNASTNKFETREATLEGKMTKYETPERRRDRLTPSILVRIVDDDL